MTPGLGFTLPPRRALGAAGALALAAAAIGFALVHAGPAVPVEIVQPHPFTEAIHGVGDLIPRQRHMIAAPFSGTIDFLVDEGKEVKAGDVVCRLDTHDVEQNIEDEQSQLVLLQKQIESDEATAKSTLAVDRTQEKSAADDLGIQRLALKQLVAGTPKAQLQDLALAAHAAERSFENARQNYTAQQALLAKGVIREIDLSAARVTMLDARRDRDVAASALSIAKAGNTKAAIAAQRLAVEKAENALAIARRTSEQQASSRVLARAVQLAEVDYHRFRIEALQHRLQAATLRAPTRGVAVFQAVWTNGTRKKMQLGDEARENRALMEIADVSAIDVKTTIDEAAIGRVKPGLPVKLHLQNPNKTFDGRIRAVGGLAIDKPDLVNREGASKVFEVLIETPAHDPAFRPGTTVDVDTLVQQLPAALSVPNQAIFSGSGSPAVFVRDARGGFERRPVTVGAHDDSRTLILAGLKAGEAVALERPQ